MADETSSPAVTSNVTPTPETSGNTAAPAASVESSSASPTTAAVTEPTVLGVADATQETKTETVKTEAAPAEAAKEPAKTEAVVEVKPEVKVDTKATEPAKTEAEVKTEDKTEIPPLDVKPYEWKFPEGVTIDKDRMAVVDKVFGEMEREGKVPHEIVQKYGQQLADLHVAEVQKAAEKVASAYQKIWKDQTKTWLDAFEKDPEIGGNRKDTTVNAAREFIRRHGGTAEQQTEIRTIMQTTGLGNHPALIRLFAKATMAMGEPKVLKAEAPPQAPSTLKTKMYGIQKK